METRERISHLLVRLFWARRARAEGPFTPAAGLMTVFEWGFFGLSSAGAAG